MFYSLEEINKMPQKIKSKYKAVYLPSHHRNNDGYVYVHILVMESKLKRELKKDEVVHHLDENKFNNTYDNLICFKNNAEHISFHRGGELVYDEAEDNYYCIRKIHYCKKCRKQIQKEGLCLDCFHKEQSKNIPSRDKLKSLIRSNSFVQLGRMFNVSDNAIRKWCKKYNLPYSTKEIKKYSEEEWFLI